MVGGPNSMSPNSTGCRVGQMQKISGLYIFSIDLSWLLKGRVLKALHFSPFAPEPKMRALKGIQIHTKQYENNIVMFKQSQILRWNDPVSEKKQAEQSLK